MSIQLLTAVEALKISRTLNSRSIDHHVREALKTVEDNATQGYVSAQVSLPPNFSEQCIEKLEELGYRVEQTGNGAKLSWSDL